MPWLNRERMARRRVAAGARSAVVHSPSISSKTGAGRMRP